MCKRKSSLLEQTMLNMGRNNRVFRWSKKIWLILKGRFSELLHNQPDKPFNFFLLIASLNCLTQHVDQSMECTIGWQIALQVINTLKIYDDKTMGKFCHPFCLGLKCFKLIEFSFFIILNPSLNHKTEKNIKSNYFEKVPRRKKF